MHKPVTSDTFPLQYIVETNQGGISKEGKYYWLFFENVLQLFRIPQGNRVGKWSFSNYKTNTPVKFQQIYIKNYLKKINL